MTDMRVTYRIGQLVRMPAAYPECRIVKIRPLGTIDVEATDDSGRCWRLSGLPLHRGRPS
ncbi:hypothetical protein LCGC14_2616790 [marine sediment metagenome]|uniref:Uncharacterized protein n=1 Tax=marine sediment metagenome TaxID=412755 RepID=A0A0F9ARV9_9ZZZZ